MPSIREIAERLLDHLDALSLRSIKLAAIEEVVRNERERCRKIAQSWEHRSDVNPARAIASAIQQGIEIETEL